MKLLDAYVLARTKRRMRRIRMAVTTLVCAVLFALLLLGSFMAAGIEKSSQLVKNYGYNQHYLVTARSNLENNDLGKTQDTIKNQMDAELRLRKITVTDAVRSDASYQSELNRRSALALNQKYQTLAAQFQARILRTYKVAHVYTFNEVEAMATNSDNRVTTKNPDPFLALQTQQVNSGSSAMNSSRDPFASWNPLIMRADSGLVRSLVQPGQTLDWRPGQPYPLLVPYSFLPQLAGKNLTDLPTKQRVTMYRQLVQHYTGTTLTYCYRNDAAQAQLTAALQYNKTLQVAKDAATGPVATAACAPLDQTALKRVGIIPSVQDLAARPLFVDPLSAPVTQYVQFKIVGYVPTQDITSKDLLTAQITGANNWGPASQPAIMPQDVYQKIPLFENDNVPRSNGAITPATLFFDFASRTDQKRFIASGCTGMACMQGSAWTLASFGNVGVNFESYVYHIKLILLWAAVVFGGIAALLLMTTVGKIIADSRQEIAIFQALGARQRDMAQVYLLYALLLAASALLVALALAVLAGLYIAHLGNNSVSAELTYAVGGFTSPLHANLFGVEPMWVLLIVVAGLVAALLGAGLPILMNSRRNVVRSMRES